MASALHPTIMVPAIEHATIQALHPAAAPPSPAIDDDAYEPIASMARELSRMLEADGVVVTWHDRDHAPVTLFTGGACDSVAGLSATACDTASRHAATHDTAARSEWAPLETTGAVGVAPGGLLTTSIPAGSGMVTITSLFHRLGEGTRARAREAAARILPVVQPFFGLWSTRLRTMARLRGLTEAVNNSDIGVLLVNARGQLMFVNATAQALIERNDGLRRNGALLSGSRLSDTLRLQAAIEHVVGGGMESAHTGAPVVAVNRRDRRPLLVAIMASAIAPTGADDCAAILYVFDPEQDLRPLVEPACKLYGLSPVETRLTCLLADGVSLADAAVAMHVREQTARSYLKQVFLKTDTNRQAELVWLMLKSAVRTAPGHRTSFI